MATVLKIDKHIGFGGIEYEAFKEQLNMIEGDVTPEIKSPGGSMFDGLQIFSELNDRSKKDRVKPIIKGLAASMGHMLSLSGSELPDIVDFGLALVHKPRIGGDTEGQDTFESNMLTTFYDSALTAMSAKSGVSRDRLEELMGANDGEGTWLTAEELKKEGLVAEIIPTEEVNKNAKMESLKEAYMSENLYKVKMSMQNNQDTKEVSMAAFTELQGKNEALNKQVVSLEAEKETFLSEAEGLRAENAELRTNLESIKMNEATDFLDGKVSDSQKDKWVALYLQDPEFVTEHFAEVKVKKEGVKVIEGAEMKQTGDKNYNFEYLTKNKPAELKSILKDNPEEYARLFNEHKNK